jgi:CheY-like chemotaxis protein
MTDKCILQVEDDEADVFMLQAVFKRTSITNPVHVVTDGEMAIDYLSGNGLYADRQKHPLPCLVLLDLKMPKVNGLEVLAWIRQQPRLKKLVVVLFSSSAQPADIDRAYELGANSYIEKPPNLERTLEMAQFFKGWWLGFNRYAPIDVTRPPSSVAEAPPTSCANPGGGEVPV